MADQTDFLAGFDMEIEVGKDLLPVGITEADIAQCDASGIPFEGLCVAEIAKIVGDQERSQRLGKASHMLGHIDERHSEIAGGMQYGKTERADKYDLARCHEPLLPQQNRPTQQADGQQHRDRRVQQPKPFEVEKASLPNNHVTTDGAIEAPMFAVDPTK